MKLTAGLKMNKSKSPSDFDSTVTPGTIFGFILSRPFLRLSSSEQTPNLTLSLPIASPIDKDFNKTKVAKKLSTLNGTGR